MAEMTRAAYKAAQSAEKNVGKHAAEHVAGKTAGKTVGKLIPGVGTAVNAGFLVHDLHKGRVGSALNDGLGMLGTPGAVASTAISMTGIDRKADKVLSPSSVKASKYPGSSKLNEKGLAKKAKGLGKFGIMEDLMKNYKKLGKWGAIPAMAIGAMIFSGLTSAMVKADEKQVPKQNQADGPSM